MNSHIASFMMHLSWFNGINVAGMDKPSIDSKFKAVKILTIT